MKPLKCPVCKVKTFDRNTGFMDYKRHTDKHISLMMQALKLKGKLLKSIPETI